MCSVFLAFSPVMGWFMGITISEVGNVTVEFYLTLQTWMYANLSANDTRHSSRHLQLEICHS